MLLFINQIILLQAKYIYLAGIPIDFIFFALILTGIAVFHKKEMQVAVGGLMVILAYKIFLQDFSIASHFIGTPGHHGEWSTLLNLFGLLTGFAILSDHFEKSNVTHYFPGFLPRGWQGSFFLLVIIFTLSAFLDNIAAALIGGTIAANLYKGKVHIGYLAAIVAASNAGGSGSVIGDTTTTMMWIDGVDAINVFHAYAGAVSALFIFGIIAARQQHRLQPIIKIKYLNNKIDIGRLAIVALIISGAIAGNILVDFPSAGVWVAIFSSAFFRNTAWIEFRHALKGSVFLLALVYSASLMPVNELPAASWQSSFMLGIISSVFDNIPLTKLALTQGGYDWGFLAYAVGFGGSMLWFGSSAGVALSNMFPQIRSAGDWVKHGWHIAVAYVIGFFILLFTLGWHPHAPHKQETENVVKTVTLH